MYKSLLKWLMVALVSTLLCGAVFAQDAPPMEAPTPGPSNSKSLASLAQVANSVRDMFGGNLVTTFKDRALAIAHRLDNIALALAGALAVAGLLWNVTLALINRDPVVETVAEAVLFASLVGFLIRTYEEPVTWVIDLGDQILNTVSPGGIAGGVGRFIASFYHAFFAMLAKAGNNMMYMDIFNIAAAMADFLISLFLLIVAAVLGIYALLELVGVLFLGPIIVGIAVSLTPIFVACLITGWTRKWFDQWLNFLVNGAMITALTAIVLELMTSFIRLPLAADGFLIGETIAMALICAGLGKIFTAIPGFADAILPGRTGAKAMTAGKGGGLAGSVASQAGKVASGGATAAGAAGKAVQAAPRALATAASAAMKVFKSPIG